MKTLTFNKVNNLSLLQDELLAAISSLRPYPNPEGETDHEGTTIKNPVMRVEGTGSTVKLTVPDDTDEDAIQSVVDAHDATKVVQPEFRRSTATTEEFNAEVARRLKIPD
jgi:hypothetical protein